MATKFEFTTPKLRNFYLISFIPALFLFFNKTYAVSYDDQIPGHYYGPPPFLGLFLLMTPCYLIITAFTKKPTKIVKIWTLFYMIPFLPVLFYQIFQAPYELEFSNYPMFPNTIIIQFIGYYVLTLIPLVPSDMQIKDRSPIAKLRKDDEMKDFARQYNARQLKVLATEVDGINSVDDMEKRVMELIKENIGKFIYLLEVEGITAPKQSLLVEYCYNESESLRESLKKAIARHLRSQILEEDLTEFDIHMEIDNLISEYEKMEIRNIGKLV